MKCITKGALTFGRLQCEPQPEGNPGVQKQTMWCVLKRLTALGLLLQVLTAVLQVRGVRVLNCPQQLSHLNHCITDLKVTLNQKANPCNNRKEATLTRKACGSAGFTSRQHFSTTLTIAHTLSQEWNTSSWPSNPVPEAGSNRKSLRKPRDQPRDGLAGRPASPSLWHRLAH